MPTFSQRSKDNLNTCDDDLRRVLIEAIRYYDFSVVCGHRNEEDQTTAHREGYSQLEWPNSKHNQYPSRAVDIIPYPSGYEDVDEFYKMATFIFAAANRLGVQISWGGHWRTFKDFPHFELREQ